MQVGVFMEFPGGTQQQYDEVMRRLNLGGKLPPHALYHFAGPSDSGWCVFDIWESREHFDRFVNDRLMQITKEVGITPAQPKFFPIHNMLTERSKAMGR